MKKTIYATSIFDIRYDHIVNGCPACITFVTNHTKGFLAHYRSYGVQ